jgi:hypothetical protein
MMVIVSPVAGILVAEVGVIAGAVVVVEVSVALWVVAVAVGVVAKAGGREGVGVFVDGQRCSSLL